MKRHILASAAIAAMAAAGFAHAGGPLGICNNAPLKYTSNSVALNYDGGGTLGTRSKASADSIVNSATALWTNVATSNFTFTRGPDLPVDVTSSNYATYIGQFTDGLNPIIYDTDGSITDLLLGAGANGSVLGFAGSASYGSPTCRYAEGQGVINGAISVSDSTMTIVMAHEIGHLIGLDHSQLDGTQGLASSNYVLMYPIAYRTLLSLHEDDAAALTALYPDTNVNAVYGTLSGTFQNAGVAVRGANIWAKEVTTGKVYSVVSDYLAQGTGNFKLLLPAGVYTLQAEPISTSFTGGSSVGPYSDDTTQPSFQAPMYTGANGTGSAISTTLGGGTPVQFVMTAGCTATTTFAWNGSGAVSGNCVTPVSVSSPASGSTLGGSSQLFQWTALAGASSYQLLVGSSVGASNYGSYTTTGTSVTVTGLPTAGQTIYVRLITWSGGTAYTRDYLYTAASVATGPQPQRARMDVDGDNRSDILWRNNATGQIYRMLMNGLAISSGAMVYQEPDTTWRIVADGDVDGDQYGDLIWRNASTGQVSLQGYQFGVAGPGQPLLTEANPAWKIVGTGDFNGDGKADVVWWNASTGQVWGMAMAGSIILSQGPIYQEPNTAWRIVAIGDFSGSGKRNQLLWRNNATGQVFLMTVGLSAGVFSQTGVMVYQEPNIAWKIVDAADFDGDGRTDILWRNDASGQVYLMLMNGSTIAGQGTIYTEPNLAWKIVAVGDYNGDSKADLLWRNDATGEVYMFMMNGLSILSGGHVYTEPSPAWRILGPAEEAAGSGITP